MAINLKENTTYKNYKIHNGRKFNYKSNDCTADYIVMFYGEPKILTKDWIVEMLRHAGRQDIGFVQARLNKKRDIFSNLESSLSRESISMLKKQSSLNVSNNWHYNARYNIKTVETGCIVIKRDKLERAYKLCKSTDLSLLAETLNNIGLRNLYNPDVRVLK